MHSLHQLLDLFWAQIQNAIFSRGIPASLPTPRINAWIISKFPRSICFKTAENERSFQFSLSTHTLKFHKLFSTPIHRHFIFAVSKRNEFILCTNYSIHSGPQIQNTIFPQGFPTSLPTPKINAWIVSKFLH